MTGVEKWIHYDNLKIICESWSTSQMNDKTKYPQRQGVLEESDVLYYELLKPSETLMGNATNNNSSN